MKLSLLLISVAAALITTSAFAQRKEIIIPAADLAPVEDRAEAPTPGKWWLNRNAQGWGAPNGTILMSGKPSDEPVKNGFWEVIPLTRYVPYRVPELVIDPKLTGWYRIYVGVYADDLDVWSSPLLQGKLSGEPYAEFLQAPRGTKEHTAQAYWKAADLTGKKIYISPAKAPMPHPGAAFLGGITQVRLVPMTEQEVADSKQERELPPADKRLFAMLDTTDEIFWYGTAENEEDIRAMIYRHRESGFGRIYMRVYGTCLDNSLSVPEAAPRWSEKDDEGWIKKQNTQAGWQKYFDLPKRFDPLAVAVAYGREAGCDVHAMVRFANYNRAPYANFWHDHPEFYAQLLSSNQDPKTGVRTPIVPYKRVPFSRVLSFAYPEVRTYYVSFFKQLASTGTKGIMIDLLRHPPIAGYEPIVTEAFKQKYGKEMEPLDIYRNPEVVEHLSSYFRLFLEELRKAIGSEIDISVRSSGPNGFALRGKEWIEAGLINTIVDGHWYSGNGPRPTIDETVAAVGTKGKAMAAAEVSEVDPKQSWRPIKGGILSPSSIEALAKAYSGRGVAAFGVYESTIHTWDPDTRRAIRASGWSYDPHKAPSKP
jgi:hypothetical protein